jgi:RimJ/RimL family protein N-acetyltransferase
MEMILLELNTSNPTVKLVEYTDAHTRQLSNFYLPQDQLEFTSLPIDKINNASFSNNSIHVVIMSNNEPAGYFALEDGEKVLKYSDNPKAMILTSFSINAKSQGKGLAKQGLKLLPTFVNEVRPDTKEVVLGVNKRNTAAINLYLKSGFADEKQIYEGPKGPQHVLHLVL